MTTIAEAEPRKLRLPALTDEPPPRPALLLAVAGLAWLGVGSLTLVCPDAQDLDRTTLLGALLLAFGAIQLRDDIENARKTIAGTGQQSIGLMGRTAQSMAMAIGEYAEYILRTGPDSDLDIAMQPYHEALAGLVGNDAKDEILQPHAQIAAMRHLLRMATAGTNPSSARRYYAYTAMAQPKPASPISIAYSRISKGSTQKITG